MYNPSRRNRNIGTAKQGYGQSNKLSIPSPYLVSLSFFERLGRYEKVTRVINGHTFLFIIEATNSWSGHACSIADIERMIGYVPPEDYGSLKFIVLRQPKRKENIVSPTWGRLIYSYEFEGDYHPAIILESADYSSRLKWKRRLCIEDQKELERLKADGHPFIADKRGFTAALLQKNVRNTQLYRTLLQFGHYVQYLQMVESLSNEEEAYGKYEERWEVYKKVSKECKEKFAHGYADNLMRTLQERKLIPFEQEVTGNNP